MKKKITKTQLIKWLTELAEDEDFEQAHLTADDLLLKFIDDKEVTKAYSKVKRYYGWG